jgi:hypothetical protein
VLSPRIKADERFRMTIEQDGHSYEFEGALRNTDITMEQDWIDVSYFDDEVVPGMRRYTINLEITANEMVRRVL